MTLTEAKQYLGDSYVLSPNYRLEESPWHNLYEPVNVALTFQHVRRRDEREGDLPPFPLRIDEPTHTVGLWSGREAAERAVDGFLRMGGK
jgi:hypothetical protein